MKAVLKAVHQFGVVGGEYYDSKATQCSWPSVRPVAAGWKEERLQQLLDRLPADSGLARSDSLHLGMLSRPLMSTEKGGLD